MGYFKHSPYVDIKEQHATSDVSPEKSCILFFFSEKTHQKVEKSSLPYIYVSSFQQIGKLFFVF